MIKSPELERLKNQRLDQGLVLLIEKAQRTTFKKSSSIIKSLKRISNFHLIDNNFRRTSIMLPDLFNHFWNFNAERRCYGGQDRRNYLGEVNRAAYTADSRDPFAGAPAGTTLISPELPDSLVDFGTDFFNIAVTFRTQETEGNFDKTPRVLYEVGSTGHGILQALVSGNSSEKELKAFFPVLDGNSVFAITPYPDATRNILAHMQCEGLIQKIGDSSERRKTISGHGWSIFAITEDGLGFLREQGIFTVDMYPNCIPDWYDYKEAVLPWELPAKKYAKFIEKWTQD